MLCIELESSAFGLSFIMSYLTDFKSVTRTVAMVTCWPWCLVAEAAACPCLPLLRWEGLNMISDCKDRMTQRCRLSLTLVEKKSSKREDIFVLSKPSHIWAILHFESRTFVGFNLEVESECFHQPYCVVAQEWHFGKALFRLIDALSEMMQSLISML